MDKKGFCILPFTTVYIENNQIKLCCESEEDTQNLLSADVSISDIWNNDFFHNIREQMLGGELPQACRICKLNELADEESKRQWENAKVIDIENYNTVQAPLPINFDVRPSNKCNLECVMCDGVVSTAIHKRVTKYKYDTWDFDFVISEGKPWEDNRFIIDHVKQNGDKIHEMKFCGGEPFLVQEVLEMIEHLVDTGDSKNIDLTFITNGTVVRSKWFSEKLVKFKSVKLNISMDGVEETAEYVRYPSKWSVVDRNIKLFKDIQKDNPHINISLAPVIHLLNALDMHRVIEYAAVNNLNIALSPVYQASNELYLSTELLTDELRKQAHDKMMSVLEQYPNVSFNLGKGFITNLLEQEQMTDEKVIGQLQSVTKYWDSHRDVKFADRYPYLEYLL
jgi:MoaA/NifB/PqqE/SkfB family radical SAM enzyme